MKIIVLYSGGMDSTVLYHKTRLDYPHAEVKAIYYDFGQPYANFEIPNLPDFVEVRKQPWAEYDKTIHFDINQPDIMYGREQFLTICAFMQEKPDMICLGILEDESGGDMSESHREATEQFLMFLSHQSCEVVYPFVELGWNKLNITQYAIENNIDIKSTITCMKSKEPCNTCNGCVQRNLVLCHLGLKDKVIMSQKQYDALAIKFDFIHTMDKSKLLVSQHDLVNR